MSSWADTISQFNPYIQQLPIEAMTQVGMYKQQKYDEGVQKIQSYVDNVAGLDVIRDIDKAYLQTKLNELGSKLRTVAAGDFSNYQLVNSVGGMATQIVKDRNVQNAVSSTAWYRKQLSDMEAAIKEGKSSQANVYDFNEKVNKWMYSNELGQSFKDRYTPYTDVKKKAMEAIKALHPKLSQYDIPFVINADGTIDKNRIADAMKRHKIEGIDENQIKQAISASLTPDDINQLGIDANYQFRGTSSEDLLNRATSNYQKNKQTALSKLAYLKQQVVSDPTLASEVNSRIEYYENQLGKDGKRGQLDEQYEDELSLIKENPNAVKLSIYKDGFVKEFANAFSWENQVDEYIDSPLRKQLNWVAEMKHKQEVENRLRYEFKEDLKRKDEANRLKAEANALKKIEIYGDPASTTWTTIGNPTDNKLNAQTYFNEHLTSVKSDIESNVGKLRQKYTDRQINEMLDDLEKHPENPTKVKPDALPLLHSLARNKNYLSSLEEKEKQLRADARTRAENNPEYQAKVKEASSEINALDSRYKPASAIFDWRTGESLTISPSQLLNDINSGKAKLSVDRAPLGNISLTYNIGGKEKKLEISKKAFGVDKVGAKEIRPILLSVSNHISKYGDLNKKLNSLENEEYNTRLAPLITTLIPEIKAIARTKDGKVPPVMYDRIKQLLVASQELDIAADDNYEVAKAESMLNEDNVKNTSIFIYRKGDSYEVNLKNPSVGKVQRLKLNSGDISRYFGSEYVSDKTQESVRLNLGKGNTNVTGDIKRAVMQKSFGDFPGVTRYDVKADLDQDLSNPELYIPMISVKDVNDKWHTFPIAGPNGGRRVGYDQGIRQLNSLTDDELIKLLQESYPKFDYSIFNR